MIYRILFLFLAIFFNGCFLSSKVDYEDIYNRSKDAVENSEARYYIDNLEFPIAGKYKISSLFGPRKSSYHDGLDIVKAKGVCVKAAHDGIIIRQDNEFSGYGKLIVLKGNEIVTMYAHLDDYYKYYDDWVVKGECIGTLGATGRVTGPHLHFETRIKNSNSKYYPVDPRVFYPKIFNN
jgi:murein DD-endopeptidase MepM/ murein hydrolase activator NlpD